MYVDGHEALETFVKVNEDVESNLHALLEFWQEQSSICTRAVNQVTGINEALTVEEVNKFSAEWKVALPEVKTAIERILKMSDLVMTHAVGAPCSPNTCREYSPLQGKDGLVVGGLLVGAAALMSSWEELKGSPALQKLGHALLGGLHFMPPIVPHLDNHPQQIVSDYPPSPRMNSLDTQQEHTISRQQTYHEARAHEPINQDCDDRVYPGGFPLF